ncbi:MAG: Mut7-C RNAse domain-containing protein [Thermodesulfobacteriota bacterium]|nr:Mut7-C RNAse domain-containing protein [Thermodesulfobacteriota bacterium]
MEIKFAAEKTLGKLAKWLRILGFDTIYPSDRTLPVENGRTLLTRTKRIRDECKTTQLIFIESDQPFNQLQEVVKALGITNEDLKTFTRCIRCNTKIRTIDKNSLRSVVPDYVWESQDSFKTCPKCQRIYWQGSHIKRSRELIKKLFKS